MRRTLLKCRSIIILWLLTKRLCRTKKALQLILHLKEIRRTNSSLSHIKGRTIKSRIWLAGAAMPRINRKVPLIFTAEVGTRGKFAWISGATTMPARRWTPLPWHQASCRGPAEATRNEAFARATKGLWNWRNRMRHWSIRYRSNWLTSRGMSMVSCRDWTAELKPISLLRSSNCKTCS